MSKWRKFADRNGDAVIQFESESHYGWKNAAEVVMHRDGSGRILVRGADAADIDLSAEQVQALEEFLENGLWTS